MRGFEIQELKPNYVDASLLSWAAKTDMARSYERARLAGAVISDEQEQRAMEAISRVTTERSLGRIKQNPGQYFAAVIDSAQVAYGRFNTWGLADQAPYEQGVQRRACELASRVGWLNRLNAPFGIFSLFGSEINHRHADDGIHYLLQHAESLANGQEIRIGASVGDPVVPILEEHGFQPTDHYANDVTHVPALRQTLYVRQA